MLTLDFDRIFSSSKTSWLKESFLKSSFFRFLKSFSVRVLSKSISGVSSDRNSISMSSSSAMFIVSSGTKLCLLVGSCKDSESVRSDEMSIFWCICWILGVEEVSLVSFWIIMFLLLTVGFVRTFSSSKISWAKDTFLTVFFFKLSRSFSITALSKSIFGVLSDFNSKSIASSSTMVFGFLEMLTEDRGDLVE